MLNEWGEVDEDIDFEFIHLWEMDDEARARIRKSDADADCAYVNTGIVSTEEVRERVLGVLADEARRMLDEGVVAAPQDLDLAMITGAGFQFWNGGLTPLLDREGVSEKVTGKRFLPPGVASVPA